MFGNGFQFKNGAAALGCRGHGFSGHVETKIR